MERGELSALRTKVRAFRLVMRNMRGVLVGLYGLDGHCVLLEGAPFSGVVAVEGYHYRDFVPAARLEQFERLFDGAKHGETSVEDYVINDDLTFEAVVQPIVSAAGNITHIMWFCRDVTAERAAMAAIRGKGTLDTLTSLPKRSVLQAHVHGLERREQEYHVLFVDLDGFKRVNDSQGHAAGDALLQSIGRCLQASVRSGELAVRLGGDEFVIVLHDTPCPVTVGQRLLENVLALTAPYGAGASMGVASWPKDGRTLEAVLRAADAAMYRVKSVLGGNFVERAEDMDR